LISRHSDGFSAKRYYLSSAMKKMMFGFWPGRPEASGSAAAETPDPRRAKQTARIARFSKGLVVGRLIVRLHGEDGVKDNTAVIIPDSVGNARTSPQNPPPG